MLNNQIIDDNSFSISIVVYKPDMEVLEKCFKHLRQSTEFANIKLSVTTKLYIVNNTPVPDWNEKILSCAQNSFKDLNYLTFEIIHSPENHGYGYGNNLAIQKTDAKFHLVMNPDVYVYEDTFINAIQYMQNHPGISLIVPDVCGEDKQRHYLCKRNPTLWDMFLRGFAPQFIKRYFKGRMDSFEMHDCNYDQEIQDIPFPTGCFMFFRTSTLKQLGGFDTAFFMYLEDADIGRRILQISHSVYVPQIKIIHKWARGSHHNWRLRWVTIKSAFIYWRKWGGIFNA